MLTLKNVGKSWGLTQSGTTDIRDGFLRGDLCSVGASRVKNSRREHGRRPGAHREVVGEGR